MDRETKYFIKTGNALEEVGLLLAVESLDLAISVNIHPHYLLSTYSSR